MGNDVDTQNIVLIYDLVIAKDEKDIQIIINN